MKIITIQGATTKRGLVIKGCHTRPGWEKPTIAFGRANTRRTQARYATHLEHFCGVLPHLFLIHSFSTLLITFYYCPYYKHCLPKFNFLFNFVHSWSHVRFFMYLLLTVSHLAHFTVRTCRHVKYQWRRFLTKI